MSGLDQTLFLFFNFSHTAPHWLVSLTVLGASQGMPAVMGATVAAALIGKSPWREQAIRAFIAVVIASIVSYVLKYGIRMPRPGAFGLGIQWMPHTLMNGMPSSHSAVAAAWAAIAVFTPTRAWLKVLFFCVALLVGWSRVALGLHFPSQVLAGWVVGALCALLAPYVAARLSRSGPRPLERGE